MLEDAEVLVDSDNLSQLKAEYNIVGSARTTISAHGSRAAARARNNDYWERYPCMQVRARSTLSQQLVRHRASAEIPSACLLVCAGVCGSGCECGAQTSAQATWQVCSAAAGFAVNGLRLGIRCLQEMRARVVRRTRGAPHAHQA